MRTIRQIQLEELLTLTWTLQQCQCHEKTKDGELIQIKEMEQRIAVHNL